MSGSGSTRSLGRPLILYTVLLQACSFDTTPSFTAHESIAAPISGAAAPYPAAPVPPPAYDAAPAFPPGQSTAPASSAVPELDAALTQPNGDSVDFDAARPIDTPAEAGATPNSVPSADAAVATSDANMTIPAVSFPASDASMSNPDTSAPTPDVVRCSAGTYSAQLNCGLNSTTPPLQVTAQAVLPLQRSIQSSDLTMVDGTLQFGMTGGLVTGTLEGRLTCLDGNFHADLTGISSPIGLPVPAPSSISGALDGKLDASGRTLSGQWWFATSGGEMCQGIWSATNGP